MCTYVTDLIHEAVLVTNMAFVVQVDVPVQVRLAHWTCTGTQGVEVVVVVFAVFLTLVKQAVCTLFEAKAHSNNNSFAISDP